MGRSLNLEGLLGAVNVLDYGFKLDGVTAEDVPLAALFTRFPGQLIIVPPSPVSGGSLVLANVVTVPANSALWLLPGCVLSGAGSVSAAAGALLWDQRGGTNKVSGVGSVITAALAAALAVGANGATNPALNVDTSTAGQATGLDVIGKAAGSGVSLAAISSNPSENLTLDALGSGQLILGSVSTGLISFGRAANRPPLISRAAPILATGNQTLGAVQLLGGIIEHPVIAATTDTTDTGANLDTTIGGAANGDSFECRVANTSAGANTITLAAGTGVTLKGSVVGIAQNKIGTLLFRKTGVGTWDCYVTVSA